MLTNLEMGRAAFVRAAKRRDSGDDLLNIVVVRLLAIAVTVSRWKAKDIAAQGLTVPENFREWPRVESRFDNSGAPGYLRLSVCPKAAGISGEEVFPVGTTLVVETFSRDPINRDALRSVFVMEKVSSLVLHSAGQPFQEGWAYATYNAAGRAAAGNAVACGICRLSLLQ